MHEMAIPASVQAIGRAGAGTNNIPVKDMSARGVPVFNAPGRQRQCREGTGARRHADGGAQHRAGALHFVAGLDARRRRTGQAGRGRQEAVRRHRAAGHTLGIIGLGKIGCLVADAAIRLGMKVIGYDPEITVDAAWSLPSQVKKANSVDEVLKHADFVTLHVPLLAATRNLINAEAWRAMQARQPCCSISRARAWSTRKPCSRRWQRRQLHYYVCDFPGAGRHRPSAA